MSGKRLVLKHLDAPARIILFTLEEFALLMLPIIIGASKGSLEWGILGSSLTFLIYRKLKNYFAGTSLEVLIYWHLPFVRYFYKYPIISYYRKYKG